MSDDAQDLGDDDVVDEEIDGEDVDGDTNGEDVDDDAQDDDVDGDADGNRVRAGTASAVLEYLVKSLVAEPDSVVVEVDEGGRRTALNVRVAPGDMGRVIGKRGRVAQSIRTVVRAAAARDDLDVDVEFLD